ncbi:MAG: Rieske 2Fe-2S domain-containing protein [Actinobacteria bacterium]|uniref:Unannotated protein n=1 Tax=freshwater metagenome TaxID=449393 RepID=A0A6J7EAI7_9ZZZZ|nr:Rieske 2Fe-2S domain-containing protein [Actinomycetota bacterium]
MTEFVRVCLLGEVPMRGAKRVEVDGVPIAIVRTDEGVFAIKDVCSHADVPLSEGEVEGCAIECWLHGSQFDLRTGAPRTLPAVSAVPVYEVRVAGDADDAFIEVATAATVVTPASAAP